MYYDYIYLALSCCKSCSYNFTWCQTQITRIYKEQQRVLEVTRVFICYSHDQIRLRILHNLVTYKTIVVDMYQSLEIFTEKHECTTAK